MKIEYISHSCLFVDTGDAKVVMDPWFSGSAFCNQWHLFPKPVNTEILNTVDHILISHGHEDHLHENSLRQLPKTATVFYPYLWKAGIKDFLGDLGFTKIKEAISYKRYIVSPETRFTFLTTSMDTLMVIESKGKVLVNLNDSLNSHHENVVRLFVNEIKKNWKKIDYLFLGLGGAGYFPNTVHHKNKNDLEVGKLREQLLVNNFCKLVRDINPKIVLPFAPGFVLLNNDKKWINNTKFPRELLMDYFKKYFNASPSFDLEIMYPGDQFIDSVLHKKSPYHHQLINNSLDYLIEEEYAEETEKVNKRTTANEKAGEIIFEKLNRFIPETSKLFTTEILHQIKFAIQLEDIPETNYFNIEFNEQGCKIYRTNYLLPDRKLLLRTKSEYLNHSLDNEWGGDIFVGGYACDIDIIDDTAIDENMDIACIRLLTRYPIGSKTMRQEPFRAIKYLTSNPILSKLSLQQKLFAPKKLNKIGYNERNRWINKSKCETCQVCDLPLLSNDFGEQIPLDKLRET